MEVFSSLERSFERSDKATPMLAVGFGILAYSEKYHFSHHSDYDDWELAGSGEPYVDCGEFGFRGCIEHHVVEKYRRSCNRAQCPTCYEGWSSLEAKKMVYRLSQYRGRWKNPCHVSFNPAPCLWLWSKDRLTKELYRVAKRLGLEGGSFIFHPKRKNKAGEWFVSIHWHGLIYGFHRGFHIRGWVVKNHGVRRTEKEQFTTARYQLSHAGFHPSRHTTVWFGSCSYNKKGFLPFENPKHCCPIGGEELRPLVWVGDGDTPPPLKDYVWKDGDWIYAVPQYMKDLLSSARSKYKDLVDRNRSCPSVPSKFGSEVLVALDLDSLRKANPLAPEWCLKLFSDEEG